MFERRNEVVTTGDQTPHAEFEIARWAAANLSPEERGQAIVYTRGEHCPRCSATHGWVGLGRIVYIRSTQQLVTWLADLAVPAPAVQPLSIREVVPNLVVDGPVADLVEHVHDTYTSAFTPPKVALPNRTIHRFNQPACSPRG